MIMSNKKPLFKVDWSKLPKDVIGACYNSDGVAWAWNVKPEIKGSEKKPDDLKWRGPTYAAGYTLIDPVIASRTLAKETWKDSWQDKPKA